MVMSRVAQKTFGPFYRLASRIRKRRLKRAFAPTEEISILSNNCVAGFIYKALGLRFCSPTIGLQMPPPDFVRFCENLDAYLDCELRECPDKKPQDFGYAPEESFPVAALGDLTVFLQHYAEFGVAKAQWEERKRRVNKNRLYHMLLVHENMPGPPGSGGNGLEEAVRQFASLPFEKKIVLSDEPIPGCPCNFALHFKNEGWYDHCGQGLFRKYSKNHYEKFDFVTWLSS